MRIGVTGSPEGYSITVNDVTVMAGILPAVTKRDIDHAIEAYKKDRTAYAVWPDGTVVELADIEQFGWKSDDFEIYYAATGEELEQPQI